MGSHVHTLATKISEKKNSTIQVQEAQHSTPCSRIITQHHAKAAPSSCPVILSQRYQHPAELASSTAVQAVTFHRAATVLSSHPDATSIPQNWCRPPRQINHPRSHDGRTVVLPRCPVPTLPTPHQANFGHCCASCNVPTCSDCAVLPP